MNNHDSQFFPHAVVLGGATSGCTAAAADPHATGHLVISGGAGADIYLFKRPTGTQDGNAHLAVSDFTAGSGGDVIDLDDR